MDDYPIRLFTLQGEWIDSAGNVESAVSVLYGDLSYHDGEARIIQVPMDRDDLIEELSYHARINADCWGIPVDQIETVLS